VHQTLEPHANAGIVRLRPFADVWASPQAAQQQPARLRETTREFPVGSYIIRMDQPYSRIADALLDYQYWAPNDPQTRPYDDTGWTFPEGFAVQAVRVTDAPSAPLAPLLRWSEWFR
jgi:hypothetical protein